MTDTMKFKVQIESAYGIRHDLQKDLTESEAVNFCEDHNWRYLDDFGFEWSLVYVEDYVNTTPRGVK